MKTILGDLRAFFVSLKLTVTLLGFSLVLVFAATLDQANLGIWAIQQKWFRTLVVFQEFGGVPVPVFPGGYLIGGLLLINLLVAHVERFTLTWRKAGIFLTHAGLILLLVAELLSGLWQEDFHLRLREGETRNYAESYRFNELVLIDTTDPEFDEVVAIPESRLEGHATIQHPKLPFRVATRAYYPNSVLRMTGAGAPPSLANAGLGLGVVAAPQPVTYRTDESNLPSAYVELIAPDGSPGLFLVSTGLVETQRFAHGGRTWELGLRPRRVYQPFSLTLLKFSHDRHAGTEIPKNFSSRVRLTTGAGRGGREVLIFMNNPLRHEGLTFYQAGFEDNDRTSILQVVRNPSWLLPYVACALMALGLTGQFGLHLRTFVQKRRPADPAPARGRGIFIPAIAVLGAVAAVAFTFRSPRESGDYDLAAFGRLPTLVNGRLKPLDTVARTTLLVTQGRQRVTTPEGRSLAPVEWLLDVLYRPAVADQSQVLEIVHPDVLAMFNLSAADGAGGKRFSARQLAAGLGALDRQAKLADDTASAVRTPFQRAVVQLRDRVMLYQRLQNSLNASAGTDFLEQLGRFAQALPAGRGGPPADPAWEKLRRELGAAFGTMDAFGYLRPIPSDRPEDPAGWKTAGAAWADGIATGRVAPPALAFVAIGRAWQAQQPARFNQAVRDHRAALEAAAPGVMKKGDVELRFNASQPFATSMVLYVVAFLLAVASWLRWPAALGRAAFGFVVLAFLLTTAGLGTRMWLEARPPVTNLYSSALFVGWGAVALCLLLETLHRNAVGSAAAGLVGFATLLIAHHLALGGDTLEMMRAVLDSNFWLATHVVTVTIGYSATFLAGFLALIYVGRGVFSRSLDAAAGAALGRMIYGVVCFATLFSFTGTVLGGIWADQSWGRFWGWDPKENGALLIVIWNAIILHARWGGLLGVRGLASLAIFGNIVTAWSWFGVNMLGVGLHSYGFMDAAFWWLIAFVASQLLVIAIALVPESKWRSCPPGRARA